MIFAFFGVPGVGKTTLCRRFGELAGVPALDTDLFMTPVEREAVRSGTYTQAMRLVNIRRYAANLRDTVPPNGHAALADGLPTEDARRFLLEQFQPGSVVLVLVTAGRALWERRLGARSDNPVSIDVAGADAYVARHWQEPSLPHERVENGEDAAAVDAALLDLFRRYAT